jgi:hypothetical protein
VRWVVLEEHRPLSKLKYMLGSWILGGRNLDLMAGGGVRVGWWWWSQSAMVVESSVAEPSDGWVVGGGGLASISMTNN